MKIVRFLILAVALVAAFLAPAATAAPKPATVNLNWQHPDPTQVAIFTLYELVGNEWVVAATIDRPNPETPPPLKVSLPNVQPGVHTYRLTAANIWGESDPTDPASTPPPVSPAFELRVTIVVTADVAVVVPKP